MEGRPVGTPEPEVTIAGVRLPAAMEIIAGMTEAEEPAGTMEAEGPAGTTEAEELVGTMEAEEPAGMTEPAETVLRCRVMSKMGFGR